MEELSEAAKQLLASTDLTDKKISLLGVALSNFEGVIISKEEQETDQLKLFRSCLWFTSQRSLLKIWNARWEGLRVKKNKV